MWKEVVESFDKISVSGLNGTLGVISNLPFPNPADISTELKSFNSATGEFHSIDPSLITNIDKLEPTKTESFEFGYKGLIGSKLIINSDMYFSRIDNFIGPLLIETPNVFFEQLSLQKYLLDSIFALDPEFLHSKNITHSKVVEAANFISGIPVGTITPEQFSHPGDVILTYRNFGDIDLFGLDMDFTYKAGKNWDVTGAFSFVNKDIFTSVGGIKNIALNAPKIKFGFGLHYLEPRLGIGSRLRYRFVDGFPVNSGVYIGDVKSYGVIDFDAGVNLPGESGIRITLTIQNVLDNRHREFIGAPEIGRLAHVQIKFFLDKYK
ncbi:TonB-dependent receptor [candidate division KSB1 bacterium]|nr:TonB-dependent receptor [candidate division KSB1 bacterium]